MRVEEITNLVDIFNASGGLPDHKLTVERMSPKAIRVILNGLMVFCGDVMYSKKFYVYVCSGADKLTLYGMTVSGGIMKFLKHFSLQCFSFVQ